MNRTVRISGALAAILVLVLSAFLGAGLVTTSAAPTATTAPTPAAVTAPHYAFLQALEARAPALFAVESKLSPEKQADLQALYFSLIHPAIQPAAYSTEAFDVGSIAALIGGICIAAGPETVGLGCLAGIAIVFGGLVLACLLSLFGVCSSAAATSNLYAGAVDNFVSDLSNAMNWWDTGSQSLNDVVQNYNELTNLSVGVWEYEAAASALTQLGNATFNPVLDLGQSGVAQQAVDTVTATEFASANDMATFMEDMAGAYASGNGWGADGVVCIASASTKYVTGFNGSAGLLTAGGSTASSLNVTGSFGGDGKCLTGVTNNDSPNGVFSYGTLLPVAPNSYAVASMNNSSVAFPLDNPLVPSGATSVEAIFSTAATHLDATPTYYLIGPASAPTSGYSVAPVATEMPAGAYFYNGTFGCGGTYLACGTAPHGTSPPHLEPMTISHASVGVGIIPINRAVTAHGSYNAGVGGTSYDSDLISNAPEVAFTFDSGGYSGPLAVACADGTSGYSFIGPVTSPSTGVLPTVSTCPASVSYQLSVVNELGGIASRVGEAYWSFLRGFGYTSVNEVPANCVIPSVESFLPPNYNVTKLSELNASVLEGLAVTMLAKMAETFGTGAPTFCGTHIPTPTSVSFPSQDLIAVGDIYVPDAAGQTFITPSTWANVSVSMAIVPSVGNLTIPVNKTWEAPAANPSLLLYGNLSGPRNATTHAPYVFSVKNASEAFTTISGVYTHFTGNSTKGNGSVYPNHVYAPYGVGGALYLTACYANVSGSWAAETDCNETVQTISYNYSNNSCQFFATDCKEPPIPPNPIECGWAIAGEIAAFIAPIPVLGAFACDIAWAVILVVGLVVVLAVITYFPRPRRGGGGES